MKHVEGIRGFIPKKQESIEDLSNKVVQLLQALKEIDPGLFSHWYEQGMSKKEALEKKVVPDMNYIANIIKNEWDKKVPELGSRFSFWSGKKNEVENARINFSIGMTTSNKNLRNVVGVSLPFKEELRMMKEDKKVKDIVAALKKIWNPDEIEID